MQIKKYDIVMVNLDPIRGSEQRGKRPCMIVQHNEVNKHARTTVICPFSKVIKRFFFSMVVLPNEENGLSCESRLDLLQIRTIDKGRITKKLGSLGHAYRDEFKQRFVDSFDLNDLF